MITKRQLGLAFCALGLLIILALFAVDLLQAGQYQGIGPTQRLGLLGGTAVLLIGLTLIPLGNRPA